MSIEEERLMKNGLVRSKYDRVISGVCGGIGEYFNIDPTIVRLGFVIATVYLVALGCLRILWQFL